MFPIEASGLFRINRRKPGQLELDTKIAMAQQIEKKVQPIKNSDPVNRIVKKKTSHCLTACVLGEMWYKNSRARC